MSQSTIDKIDLLKYQKQQLMELIDQLEESVNIGNFETETARKYTKQQLRECQREADEIEKQIEILSNQY